jgi:hypothetical protein
MSRWVIPSLFKVQAAIIDWGREMEILGYEGPFLETGMDPGFVHFRWMLHPAMGLPVFPFIIWRRPDPGTGMDAQQLANLDGWEAIEMIGLPIDEEWNDIDHHLSRQGPVDQPVPPMSGTLNPFDAAMRRLQLGAPRIGWTRLTLNSISLEDWKSPELGSYLSELPGSSLLRGVHNMLREHPNGFEHSTYVIVEQEAAGQNELQPHLLLNGRAPFSRPDRPARGEWRPLGLLLLAAGTDPLAALALGFGTALHGSGEEIYMVTVQHHLTMGNTEFDFELADIVRVSDVLQAPASPDGLQANLIGGNRPQEVDGPALQTVGVAWNRRENPIHTPQSDDPFPVSYGVGRFGPHPVQAEILLAKREPLEGWMPFVASKPEGVRPVLFTDHITRLSTIGGQPFADPHGVDLTYAVAAQDIFGRWSRWNTIPVQLNGEGPQTPSVLSVAVDDSSGNAVIDFAWDWSERSPEFVEISGAYADDPGNLLLSTRLTFQGQAEPDLAGSQVDPLDPDRQLANGWGAPQDRDGGPPEVRFYRLSVTIPLDFAGQPERVFQVRARGQCHLHHVWGAARFRPDFNISPFSSPVSTHLFDPAPPTAPTVPEAPQWASLRDPAGVSRFELKWGTDSRVDGYVLYEATETSLLAALNLPGPDTSRPFTERLAILRAANLPSLRNVFRRIRKELIPPTGTQTSYEVSLPRGSTVMHFYALTSMSHNQVESAWPDASTKFVAVAVPRLAVPTPPTLIAEPDPAQPSVQLSIGLGEEPVVGKVELFRTSSETLAANADLMGPPLISLPANGTELTFTDISLTPGWQRHLYRAVAWSARDDQRGLVEARSPASAPASVILLPTAPPDLFDLRVDEPGSGGAETLISWTSKAPLEITPVGSHVAVVEVHDFAGSLVVRLEANLDTLPAFDSLATLPPADPTNRRIARVGPAGDYRLYVWLPRPAEFAYRVRVKMIDPLGRISIQSEDVFPMAVLMVPVPDLVGEDLDVAVQKLTTLGLVPVIAEVLLADQETAIVDSLTPPVGASVEAGAQILVTPTDRPLVPVPDVRNKSLADAKAALEFVGLVPEEALVALADFSTAIVDFTEPPQGTPVREGTTVVISLKDST